MPAAQVDPASGPDVSGIRFGVDVSHFAAGLAAAREKICAAFGIPPEELDDTVAEVTQAHLDELEKGGR